MKKLIPIFILILFGCRTSQKLLKNENNSEFEIVEISIGSENHKMQINELRIYNQSSSVNTSIMIHKEFGKWSEKLPGKYQNNIDQYLWENVNLSDTLRDLTIVTDGTETINENFTSLLIYDSNFKDCLNPKYKYQNRAIEIIMDKMRKLNPEFKDYQIFY